ncbi:MAG: hypothetical protein ACRENH_11460 [Gemmatimonadaceae bacterium]
MPNSRMLLLLSLICACKDELAQYDSQGPRYEARAWLVSTGNSAPFASNRFSTREAARAFIDSLYAAGADSVWILNVQTDSAMVADEGGPYADAPLVRLPNADSARNLLFDFEAREARHEGFDPERDRGQRYLYFWWD